MTIKRILKLAFSLRAIVGVGLGVLVILLILGPKLRRDILYYRTTQALQEATPADALLSAKHLINSYPAELAAARLYLQASRQANQQPSAAMIQQLLNQFPDSPDVTAAIALLEFQHGHLAKAQTRLENDTTQSLDQIRLAMIIAQARGHSTSAEQWAQQLAVNPDRDDSDLLAAAQILLASEHQATAESALPLLTEIDDAEFVFEATIQLARQSLDPVARTEARNRMLQLTGLEPAQRFRQLDLLAMDNHPGIEATLLTAQQELKAPANIARLIGWMNAHGRAKEAIVWAGNLHAAVMEQEAISFALAESHLYAGDRSGLHQHLTDARWPNRECIRLALISLCITNERLQEKFWQRAVKQAAEDGQTERLIQTLALWGVRHPEIPA